MRLVLLLLLFLGISIEVKCQSVVPSLVKMNSLTSSSFAAFDTYARSIGFTFFKKSNEEVETLYMYTRRVKLSGDIYTEVFAFRKWAEQNYANIIFTTFRVDLNVHYQNQITTNKYHSVDCLLDEEENEVAFCYQTSKFGCRLVDKRRNTDVGVSNEYTVVVWKK